MDASKNIRRKLYNISAKTGKGTIYIYYSCKGEEKKFPTGIKLDAERWDKKKSEPKRGALTNDDARIVDSLYNDLVKLITDYQYEYKELPGVAYLEQNLNKPKPVTDIHQLFEEYVNRIAVTNDLAPNTVAYYKQCGRRVKEVDKHYKYNLTVDNLNYSFIQLFITYCKTVKVLSNTTIKQRLDVLKSFVRDLGRNEIQHDINIEQWNKIKKDKTEMLCLERDELDAILKYTPKSNREQKIKDIIVFLSHTGMRVGDMQHIKKENVVDGMLVFKPVKSTRYNIVCKVPIAKPVMKILERYNYKLPSYTGKYLNPYIADFCGQIKEIKKKGKQAEHTSHTIGRKTFLNLCIQAGVPIPTVMGMSGHTQIDTVIKHYLDKHQNSLPHLTKVFEF